MVFRSFANPKYDTTKPGIIALRDIRKNNLNNEFLVHIKPQLKYCLKGIAPVSYATSDYKFSINGAEIASSIRQTPQIDSMTPVCFSSNLEQADLVVIINPNVASLLTALDITRQN